jgi:hypothetical protein
VPAGEVLHMAWWQDPVDPSRFRGDRRRAVWAVLLRRLSVPEDLLDDDLERKWWSAAAAKGQFEGAVKRRFVASHALSATSGGQQLSDSTTRSCR